MNCKVFSKNELSIIINDSSYDNRNRQNEDVCNEVIELGEISCSTVVSDYSINKMKMRNNVFMLYYLFTNIPDKE